MRRLLVAVGFALGLLVIMTLGLRRGRVESRQPHHAGAPPPSAPVESALSSAPHAAMPVAGVSRATARPHSVPAASPEVRLITDLVGGADGQARTVAIRRLSPLLVRQDVEALYEYLRRPFAEQRQTDELTALNAMKNDVLEALLAQKSLPPDLARTMLDMCREPGLDEMWRGYCVQFLPVYYERKWLADPSATGNDDPERTGVLQALWDAAGDGSGALCATALLALSRLAEAGGEVDRERLARTSAQIAIDRGSRVEARTSAIQVCAAQGRKDVLDTARILAQTAETIPLRLAAIGALGQVGDQTDVDLLASLEAGRDKYAQNAARRALGNLKRRLQPEP